MREVATAIIQGPEYESSSSHIVELLNHGLRLEYSGVTHLPCLDSAVQDVFVPTVSRC